jgi:hypothetical protein
VSRRGHCFRHPVATKAVWGRESDLSPDRSDALLHLLRNRFSVTGDSVKGAGQLARVISAIVGRRWLGPLNEFDRVQRVFPVIIVHDRLSGSPGFGAFVRDEFRKALGPHVPSEAGQFSCGQLNVFGPIVLTAEDVELLEVSVERSGIRDLLAEYSRWSPDRMLAFSAYLAEISALGPCPRKSGSCRHLDRCPQPRDAASVSEIAGQDCRR